MQMPALDDTIIAVSSGWQATPLGIVRLSGTAAFELLERGGVSLPAADTRPNAGWCEVSLALPDDLNLPATVFWFHAPRSYTGQDVAEIHTVGSLPALRALSAHLIDAGARRALPGEFTARAYLNGRLNRDQVEGVLALINAQDQTAARQAARLSRQSYRPRVEQLTERLTELIALVEAGIDFVEEEDIHFITPTELTQAIDELVDEINAIGRPGRSLQRPGQPHIALAGLPNAGKSTLFIALLGYERAIVTPVLGTTRDVLSAKIEVGGVAAVLQDCAGLGPAADELESAAHLAAEQAADQADFVLWLHDRATCWDARETEVCRRIPEDRRLLVFSKCDRRAPHAQPVPPIGFAATAETSALSGTGLSSLRRLIAERLETLGESSGSGLTTEHLGPTLAALHRARDLASGSDDALALPELVALELRRTWESLDWLDRGPLVEDVLGNILSRFCIGK